MRVENRSLQLEIEHVTRFEYDDPVYESATEVRLHPSARPDALQRCLSFDIQVNPQVNIFHYTDYFGSIVHHFNVLQSLERLTVTTRALVETGPGWLPAAEWAHVLYHDYLSESKYVRIDDTIRELASAFQDTQVPFEMAERLCRHIHETFVYEKGVTDTNSTSAEVVALRQGVCQDFAHVMIAACRAAGVPARYVSGYAYFGPDTEGQERASHAWCEIYAGQSSGYWIGFDPTHEDVFVDERYVRIGAGRDYADLAPVRGTYKGTGKARLDVSVNIRAVR